MKQPTRRKSVGLTSQIGGRSPKGLHIFSIIAGNSGRQAAESHIMTSFSSTYLVLLLNYLPSRPHKWYAKPFGSLKVISMKMTSKDRFSVWIARRIYSDFSQLYIGSQRICYGLMIICDSFVVQKNLES